MTQRRCLSCGTEAPPDARFCGRCGAALPEGPGAPVEDGATATPGPRVPPVAGTAATGTTVAVDPPPAVPATEVSTTSDGGRVGRRSGRRPRRVLGGVVLALLAVVAAGVATRAPQQAIVVGDGLVLASGAGPGDRPTMLWAVDVSLSDPVPPVVVDDTIVLGGSSDDVAVAAGVDVASGRSLWRVPLGLDLSLVAVLASGDDVVTVATDGEATAVARVGARSGQPVWPTRSVLFGDARAAVALPEGRVLVELAAAERRRGRAVVLGAAGDRVLDVEADLAAAAADLVAVVDGAEVRTFAPDGDPVSTTALADAPVDALAVTGGLAIVAAGERVDASDALTGEPRWSTTLADRVVALAPSATGVAAVTVGDHVGLGLDGEQRWRGDGYPLPLVRDGDPVTALVAPGVEDAVVVEVRRSDGRATSSTGARDGRYVALGGDVVLTATGDEVVGTPVEPGGDTAPWRVTTPGEVRWVVLDGPRMIVAGERGDETSLSSWR